MFYNFFTIMNFSTICFKGIPNNYSKIDNFISRSAQPKKDDFAWLKEQGVTDIINFRTMYDSKIGFDEKKIVEALGMHYHNIPTITSQPNEAQVNEFLNLVDSISQNGGKTHIHCYAGADRTGLYAFIYKMKKGIDSFFINKNEWISKGHNTILYPKLIPWAEKFIFRHFNTKSFGQP